VCLQIPEKLVVCLLTEKIRYC